MQNFLSRTKTFVSEERNAWLMLATLCVLVLAFSHFVLQEYLYMRPCEKCVYIRFAVFCILVVALLALVLRQRPWAWEVGYVGAMLSAGFGMWNGFLLLSSEGVNNCSVYEASAAFPSWLPMDKILPALFKVTGVCGDTAPFAYGKHLTSMQKYFIDQYLAADGWYLIPSMKFGSVAGCSIVFFFLVLLALSTFAISRRLK